MAPPKPTLLSRDGLIQACDEVIEANRADWEKRWQQYNEAQAQERSAWIERYNDHWDKAANAIKRAVRGNHPITSDMLPRNSNRNIAVFSQERYVTVDGRQIGRPTDDFRAPAEIVGLRNALTLHQDESITPNGLEALGITKSTLRTAIQHMGAIKAAQEK